MNDADAENFGELMNRGVTASRNDLSRYGLTILCLTKKYGSLGTCSAFPASA